MLIKLYKLSMRFPVHISRFELLAIIQPRIEIVQDHACSIDSTVVNERKLEV